MRYTTSEFPALCPRYVIFFKYSVWQQRNYDDTRAQPFFPEWRDFGTRQTTTGFLIYLAEMNEVDSEIEKQERAELGYKTRKNKRKKKEKKRQFIDDDDDDDGNVMIIIKIIRKRHCS